MITDPNRDLRGWFPSPKFIRLVQMPLRRWSGRTRVLAERYRRLYLSEQVCVCVCVEQASGFVTRSTSVRLRARAARFLLRAYRGSSRRRRLRRFALLVNAPKCSSLSQVVSRRKFRKKTCWLSMGDVYVCVCVCVSGFAERWFSQPVERAP